MTLDDEFPRSVVMLGAFPPPIGGAARNNAMLAQTLEDDGVDLTRINLSGDTATHHRTIKYHAKRVLRNAAALAKTTAKRDRRSLLYAVPDGGAGAWYTLAHVSAAANGYGRLVLHHHTFRYINQFAKPVGLMVKVAPADRTTHVFLSEGMADRFQQRYGAVDYLVASNARFVAEEANRPALPRTWGPLRLGHLSNLCRDKGFFETVEAFELLRKRGVAAELHLAGPVLSHDVQHRLDAMLADTSLSVHYHGPLFGIPKRDFYRSIDAFLFPTSFDQEAAPSVLYEALAAGRPTLSVRRGCIEEMVRGDRGAICETPDEFPEFAAAWLAKLDLSEAACTARANAIKTDVGKEAVLAQHQYSALMALLGARDPGRFVQEY